MLQVIMKSWTLSNEPVVSKLILPIIISYIYISGHSSDEHISQISCFVCLLSVLDVRHSILWPETIIYLYILLKTGVSLVEHKLLTFQEDPSSLPVFSRVTVDQSLLFCVVSCRSLFVFSEVCVAQSSLFCVVFCRSLFAFSEVCVAQSLLFCVVFCRSLFVFSEVCVT